MQTIFVLYLVLMLHNLIKIDWFLKLWIGYDPLQPMTFHPGETLRSRGVSPIYTQTTYFSWEK